MRKALLCDTELSAVRRVGGVELCRMRTGSTRDGRRKLWMVYPVHHIGTVEIGRGWEIEPCKGWACKGGRSRL